MTEEEIFDAVLQLPESRRETYLQYACQNDTKLLESVQQLLKYHSESSGFMKASAVETLVDPEWILSAGSTIGPYRLLEPLGQGGMGIVYRAVQSEPVKRQVAIKVIKPGLDTREIVSRFRAEQRALAVMDHPFIAKVLEAGATATGRPYFVMELVDGVSITEYCDREKLSIEARLQLIIDVSAAVQHAHSKSIIHRDIKPTNVLVVQHEGRPVPKVIDFGVAKALDQETTDQTFQTQTTQVIGTPIYMSPEQADASIQDIDTRTDIYSLGVLTYELLTGYTPFDRDRLRRVSIEEVRRIIRQEEPPKPSSRLKSLGEKASEQAVVRGTDTKRLTRRLHGDLDWIVMKALDKDRERRYETANDLANDLRRFLNYEPVLASPPSRLYRLKRTLWRHRVAVSVSAAMLTLSCLGTLGTAWGLLATSRANRNLTEALASRQQQLRATEREREVAEREREVAESVVLFLNRDLLSAATPSMDEGKGHDVRMRDVLLAAGKNIDKAAAPGGPFHGKILVEAQIRTTIGRTFVTLGLYSDGIQHLERARQLLDEGNATEEQKLPTLYLLSETYNNVGRMTEGIDLAKLVIVGEEKLHGADSEKCLTAKFNLSFQLHSLGRYEECLQILQEILPYRLRDNGPTDWVTLETELGIAGAYIKLKKFDAAEELYQKALQVGRERQDPNVLSYVLKSMAEIRFEQGKYKEAQLLLEESFVNASKHFGPDHPETNRILGLLGVVDGELGDSEGAKKKLTTVYEVNMKASGPVGSPTVVNRLNLVLTLWNANFRREADELSVAYLKETTDAWGHDNLWVRRIFLQLDLMADVYEQEGELARAEPFRRVSLEHDLALAAVDEPAISDLQKAALALADSKHPELRDLPRAISLLEKAINRAQNTQTDQIDAINKELERLRSLK